MVSSSTRLALTIQRIQSVCLFDLTWGQGQRCTVETPWPAHLTPLYDTWQRAYLRFYQTLDQAIVRPPHPRHADLTAGNAANQAPGTAPTPAPRDAASALPPAAPAADHLRGRSLGGGAVKPTTVDWHERLVSAEAQLQQALQQWWRSGDLFPIRTAIAAVQADHPEHPVDLLLTCTPLAVARLPWEQWAESPEFQRQAPLRIVRSPANIQAPQAIAKTRAKPRILVILGDNTGLDIHADWQAIQVLQRRADIQVTGWQPGQATVDLKAQICAAIAAPQGWDLLLFAGHSNETTHTGGSISIAPNLALSMQELTPHLQTARHHGLQFALFNSCNGLNLAESLINLGFSQVAIMREPIHNAVAQVFIETFMTALAADQNVHAALLTACDRLRTCHNVTFPATASIPSLFRHPQAELYALPRSTWRDRGRNLRPKLTELVALAGLVILSWQVPVQTWLLNQRLYLQALYRDVTPAVLAPDSVSSHSPALLLVQIDNASLVEDGISDPNPMDRTYLARLVQQAADLGVTVVGVDYLLDRPQDAADPVFADTLARVTQQNTWTILGASRDDQGVWLMPTPAISAGDYWSGDIRLWLEGRYLTLIFQPDTPLPFSQAIALAHREAQALAGDSSTTTTLRDRLGGLSYLDQQHLVQTTLTPAAANHRVTEAAYNLRQLWLHPMTDFSVPPAEIYDRISAWEFLRLDGDRFAQDYGQTTVIIMPAGYEEAGTGTGADLFPLPNATRYWRRRQSPPDPRWLMPGVEIHAYGVHQFLHNRLVVPIPDLWLIGLAIVVGKGLAIAGFMSAGAPFKLREQPSRFGLAPPMRSALYLSLGLLAYGGLSAQIFLSVGLLLPWLLPSLTLVVYWVVYGWLPTRSP